MNRSVRCICGEEAHRTARDALTASSRRCITLAAAPLRSAERPTDRSPRKGACDRNARVGSTVNRTAWQHAAHRIQRNLRGPRFDLLPVPPQRVKTGPRRPVRSDDGNCDRADRFSRCSTARTGDPGDAEPDMSVRALACTRRHRRRHLFTHRAVDFDEIRRHVQQVDFDALL